MKYKIIANDQQLRIISDALESYTRLGIGQLENVLMDLGFRTYEQFKDNMSNFHDIDVKDAMGVIKRKIFNMPLNASHSIGNKNVHRDFKVCYDLYISIKNRLNEKDVDKLKMSAIMEECKVSDNGNMIIEVYTEEEEKINARTKKKE